MFGKTTCANKTDKNDSNNHCFCLQHRMIKLNLDYKYKINRSLIFANKTNF